MHVGSEGSERPGPAERGVRFEATVHPGVGAAALERVADLDLDRLPDPEGGVRVVISADDAARLVDRGYEVLLVRSLPVQPLDASLVMDDDVAGAWLEERTSGIDRRPEGS